MTETLLVADAVEIEAYAHPDAKLNVNDKIKRENLGLSANAGEARKEKAKDFRDKMAEHQAGDGVFKRGAC